MKMVARFASGTTSILKTSAFVTLLCVALFAGVTTAAEPDSKPIGPAMMVHFDYYRADLPQVRLLERRLDHAIRQAHAGELGESELHLDGNDGYLYMYGPDPDRLYAVAGPILRSSKLTADAEVTKWHGARTEMFPIRAGRAGAGK
jgi:hypothetical protein